ncbi:hypothetical protein BDV59DRAFT_188820 [Aspergillus ambiguus]|uniref:uncharacterized protein n=1 Tax=Aspergillus ambiguus TaxID=176160 RepID=UPI003CCD58FE
MPSSAVFSYWRRDHRRSSAAPVSPPAVKNTNNAPQLPAIPPTAALTTPYDASPAVTGGSSPHVSLDDHSPDGESDKAAVTVSTTKIDAPSSSSINLAVPPSTTSERQARPRSSPEERERDSPLTAQSNYSQPSFPASRPDPADGESSKPSSPFRLSFGKGLLTSHSHSSDNHSKRSSAAAMAPSSHLRFKASPDTSPAERHGPSSQKEYKSDGAHGRRQGDHDVSAEHGHHKSGKAMLHLLNPMALLARRRSSQIAGLRAEDMHIGPRNLVPAIPDDYDPRIRGNIVHDFSAPRPRRNLAATPALLHEVSSAHDRSQSVTGVSAANESGLQAADQRKRYSEHSPVFREHFEDDPRALQVENKAYLQSSLLVNPSEHDRDSRFIPIFARNLPSNVPEQNEEPRISTSPGQPPQEALSNESSQPTVSQDTDTIELVPSQRVGLPRHLKSNASRFSFDMNGVESSTQEKLLEEKHKQKEAARRARAHLEGASFSDEDDDFDNDLYDDMDGLEEKIPGVNADADEDDEFNDFSGPGSVMSKSWLADGPSNMATQPVLDVSSISATPNLQDSSTLASGDETKMESSLEPSISPSPLNITGLGATDDVSAPTHSKPSEDDSRNHTGPPLQSQVVEDDDDLYFDDGEFGDLTAEVDSETFDESIFDDESSHLYERKPVGPVSQEVVSEHVGPSSEIGYNGELKHMPSVASEYHTTGFRRHPQTDDAAKVTSAKTHGGVLSEQNLEAFHNALVQAANQTATEDRFGRNASISERSLGQKSIGPTLEAPREVISADDHLVQPTDGSEFEEVFEDFSYDDNDASFYDDPIIAAANAEALENDDEGFYGQEFGFYAQAYGPCSSELTNGGYFGPRGVEGISRSFSSRGKFREPSLTPITERSEWSTRNSVISLTAAHGAAHSNTLSSPGLAQLVDMGNIEDEMSLSALMRLRRGAWGGSNGSLRSSSGSPPPHPHSSSNRGSFTGLSDVSPTVYTAPPDLLGPSLMDSSEKGGSTQSPIDSTLHV